MPEQRPPFPAQYGLWDKPTAINNVETLANAPVVLRDGPHAFSRFGSATTGGSKIVTVYGSNEGEPHLVEVPFGTPLRAILQQAGFTKLSEQDIRAVVVGGAEGGALPLS